MFDIASNLYSNDNAFIYICRYVYRISVNYNNMLLLHKKKDCGKHVCHCGRLNILKSDFLYFIVNFSAKFYMDLPLTPCCHSSKVQEIGFHFKFTAMAYIFSAFFFLCVLLFEALKLAFQTRFRCSWNNKKFNKMQLFHWHFFLSNNYYHTQH